MTKPLGVTVTAGIMSLFILLGLIAAFTMTMPPTPGLPIATGTLAAAAHGMALFGALVSAVCVFFYYKGQNWARWVVMIDCVFVLFGLISLAKTFHLVPFAGILTIAKVILAIYLLYYLNTPPAKPWFESPTPTV
jgi:hypothetical protein